MKNQLLVLAVLSLMVQTAWGMQEQPKTTHDEDYARSLDRTLNPERGRDKIIGSSNKPSGRINLTDAVLGFNEKNTSVHTATDAYGAGMSINNVDSNPLDTSESSSWNFHCGGRSPRQDDDNKLDEPIFEISTWLLNTFYESGVRSIPAAKTYLQLALSPYGANISSEQASNIINKYLEQRERNTSLQ
jgi:hypothetical protein